MPEPKAAVKQIRIVNVPYVSFRVIHSFLISTKDY